ncbi:hypothetical protein ACOSP7_013889 [Xanthoceras sorbifolium]
MLTFCHTSLYLSSLAVIAFSVISHPKLVSQSLLSCNFLWFSLTLFLPGGPFTVVFSLSQLQKFHITKCFGYLLLQDLIIIYYIFLSGFVTNMLQDFFFLFLSD